MRFALVSIFLFIDLVVSGCSTSFEIKNSVATTAVPIVTHGEELQVATDPAHSLGEATSVVEVAIVHLSRRLDLDRQRIEVLSVERREWRDESLGCPKPGGMYAQVMTPGYQILLQAGEDVYEYHTDHSSRVVLCGARDIDTLKGHRSGDECSDES